MAKGKPTRKTLIETFNDFSVNEPWDTFVPDDDCVVEKRLIIISNHLACQIQAYNDHF